MKGLCPDCLTMHTGDCPEICCPRCGELMYAAAEAEGCEDYHCPMREADADEQYHILESNRKYHRTTAPWGRK